MRIKVYILLLLTTLLLIACNNAEHDEKEHKDSGEIEYRKADEESKEKIHFSEQQFRSLSMKVDTLPKRNMTAYVEANGQLEVPPQNQATVTAIIGANIMSIKVIEGEKIKKGQVLAYLSHPDIISLQTDYINSWYQLQYLEKEYQRQKKLYEEQVGSGKDFQKTQAEYQAMKGTVKGYEVQLKLIGMDVDRVLQGRMYEQVPLVSPISGYVRLVEVKTGQYVQPQTEMFELVNVAHIHSDLMVFEKDMHKVKKGQRVMFSIESLSGKELEAIIYSVGKSFEQDPKAIHIHAEIENKEGLLIPGMYVRGRIIIDDVQSNALPEAALVREGDKYFIFTAEKEVVEGREEWIFEPLEVIAGSRDDGWVEIKLLKPLPNEKKVAQNNAYYLMAEIKKGEAEHSH